MGMLGKSFREIFREDKEDERLNKMKAGAIFIMCFVFLPIIIGVWGAVQISENADSFTGIPFYLYQFFSVSGRIPESLNHGK